MKCEPVFRWTPREDEVMRRHYPIGGIDACYPRLRRYRRSAVAIHQRAYKLGLIPKKSTAAQEKYRCLIDRRKAVYRAYLAALRCGDETARDEFAAGLSGRAPLTTDLVDRANVYGLR